MPPEEDRAAAEKGPGRGTGSRCEGAREREQEEGRGLAP